MAPAPKPVRNRWVAHKTPVDERGSVDSMEKSAPGNGAKGKESQQKRQGNGGSHDFLEDPK
jgi:hypothetical protein